MGSVGIYRYQTGAPLTISGTQVVGRRADQVDGVNPYVAGAPVVDASTGTVTYLTAAAFTIAPTDRLGNAARGSVRGPGYQNWDITVRKQIPLKGTVRVQFEASFYNAFNMLNWQNPSTNLTGSGFGLITAAQPSRQVQLGFRVTF